MLFYFLLPIAFAQFLTFNGYTECPLDPNTQQPQNGCNDADKVLKGTLLAKFSDKFSCFKDTGEVYRDYFAAAYTDNRDSQNNWFVCCGLMANGRRQCDRMVEWRLVGDSRFALCEENWMEALNPGGDKMRRDLCCENSDFNDCGICSSFMVWDFTGVGEDGEIPTQGNIGSKNFYGGDNILEMKQKSDECAYQDPSIIGTPYDVCPTLDNRWRAMFNDRLNNGDSETSTGKPYPPYAYENDVYPGGFARGTLQEFNDPPVCVYAPEVAGRVIEVKVEPEEAGSQVCVDDLHEDSLQKNNPGVTQACDDTRLQTCFPDATPDDSVSGFAFLISCSESCADGPVDLWFRLRASVMKWTDAGEEENGTDRTEVNTEMWCMWGNQDMRAENGETPFPEAFPELDGDFSKWDVFPSDLAPEEDPVVFPVEDGVSMLTITSVLALLAILF